MRKSSIAATTIIGISAFGASLLVGQQQEVQALSLGTSLVSGDTLSNPTASANPTPTPTTSGGATSGPTSEPTQTSTPTPTPSDTSAATGSGQYQDGDYRSDAIRYKYGVMELGVTVSGGSIQSIDLIQASTTGRGYDKAPPILVDAAIKAQGANFGNLTGATFATQAFKKALENALSQATN